MFLPHVFLVDDAPIDTQIIVSLALSDWSVIDTGWMCNENLPNGKTYRSSIDITVVEVETSRHFANAWVAKLADIGNKLAENDITRVKDAVAYVVKNYPELIQYME